MDLSNKIPEHFKCPICFEVPPNKVLQCRRGHTLCERCYAQLSTCPQCRVPLDKEPIRTLAIEQMLDELTLECPFKSHGCHKPVNRKSFEGHVKCCSYDIARFGSFVNVCKAIGTENCSFQTNTGNIAESIHHLVSHHDAMVLDKDSNKVKVTDITQGTDASIRSWVILNWKESGYAFLIDLYITPGEKRAVSMSIYYWLYPTGSKCANCEFSLPPYQVECSLIKANHYITWSVPAINILNCERETSEIFSMNLPAYLFVDEATDSLSIRFKLVKAE